MRSNNSNGSRVASARGFMALFAIVLAMGLASGFARRKRRLSSADVANSGDNTVSVIGTATNTVVGISRSRRGFPYWGRRHPGWDKGLCHEFEWRRQHGFGDQNGHQHGGEDGSGGVWPHWGRGHPGWDKGLRRE